MDLEQRVQILEQELQILKGQIQITLLDIQEHLLTNAYPALRAEAPTENEMPVPVEAPRNTARVVRPASNDEEDEIPPAIVKRVSLEEIEPPAKNGKAKAPRPVDDEEDEAAPGPVVRKVTFNDQPTQPRRPAKFQQMNEEDDEDEQVSAPAVRKINANNQSRGQVREPVDFSEEIVDSYEAEPPARPSNGHRPKPYTPEPAAADNGTNWTALNRLAEWVGDKVKTIGVERTRQLIEKNAQKGNFSAEIKEALLQLVLLYDADGSLNTQRLDAVLEDLTMQPDASESEPSPEQMEEQKLILRLIAGVQNVGANTAWRKNK